MTPAAPPDIAALPQARWESPPGAIPSAQPQAQGVFWLSMAMLLLFAVPKLNIKLETIPIYFIDIPATLAFLYAMRLPRCPRPPFANYLSYLLMFIVLGEFAAVLYFGAVLEPLYALARNLIAISTFYSVAQLIRTPQDVRSILMPAAIGVIVTSTLMILSSLPMTRSLVLVIATNTYLEPAADQTLKMFTFWDSSSMRGWSLIGVSILGGAFINILLPLTIMLFRWPRPIGIWRHVVMVSLLLAPLGSIVSYSRSAVLGLILVAGTIIWFGSGRMRVGLLVALGATATIILSIGANSDLFMFDRVETRMIAAIDDPYENERESERMFAYIEPFHHLIEHRQFLFFGEGSISQRLSEDAQIIDKASHSVFAKAYYSYGMIAAFMYVGLIILMFRHAFAMRRRTRPNDFGRLYINSVIGALVAVVPFMAFDHSGITDARSSMMIYFVVGLIAAARHFVPVPPHASRPLAARPQ